MLTTFNYISQYISFKIQRACFLHNIVSLVLMLNIGIKNLKWMQVNWIKLDLNRLESNIALPWALQYDQQRKKKNVNNEEVTRSIMPK